MTDKHEYFSKAETWSASRESESSRSKFIAWTIAGIAAGIAALEAVALAMLLPLKTTETMTLLVDRQTGFAQAVDPKQPQSLATNDALKQSLLAQYVIAREGYDRSKLSYDYRRVGLWSTSSARSSYISLMSSTNPESPINRLPSGAEVLIQVKSVSYLSDGNALVRFSSQRQDRGQRVVPLQHWISVIKFGFSNAQMSFEDRLINPLGFQVSSYRRDAESPPPDNDQIVERNSDAALVAPGERQK